MGALQFYQAANFISSKKKNYYKPDRNDKFTKGKKMTYRNRKEEILAKQAEKESKEKNQAAFAEFLDRTRSNRVPIFHADHKMPTTRRELLQCGVISSLATIALPNLFGIASSQLLGAELECSGGGAAGDGVRTPGYVEVQLDGGWGAAHNVFASKDPNGSFLPLSPEGYQSNGLGADNTPDAITPVDLGALMHPNTGFYQGLSSVMSADNLAKVRVSFMANESDNDTGRNVLSVTDLAALVHGGGALSQSVEAGTHHAKAFEEVALARANVEDENALGSLVDPGLIAQRLAVAGNQEAGRNNAIETAKVSYELTQNKLDAMSEKLISKQSKNLVACGYKGASELLVQYTRNQIIPSEDPVINTGNFGDLAFNQIAVNDSLLKAAIMGKVLGDGLAATGTIRLGGYDYHGRGVDNQQNKDREAGETVGIMLEIAGRKGQPLFVAVTSDGSVSYNGNSPGISAPSSDNSVRGAVLMIAIGTDAAPEMKRSYIGTFGDGGAVDPNSSITATRGPAAAFAMVYNYAAFAGKMSEFSKIAGGIPEVQALKEDEHLAFAPKS